MITASTGRWAPFWVSLTFAAVFIALRVGYRLVFGSFSWTAVLQAVDLALPFAAVIVMCGFLSAVVDVRRLLPAMSGLRYGKSVGTALAIALASYPTLIHQVSQLDTARKLRGMRSRSAFLVPLLEHTIERAVALAAAMDVRGFGSTPHSVNSVEGPRPEIVFSDFSLSYGTHSVLQHINLTLSPGSLTVLTGQTGSGKTAVLESIAGLSQHFHNGTISGELRIGTQDRNNVVPRNTASVIGFVPQNVRLSFAADTARHELEFGLRVTGQSRRVAASRAETLLHDFSLAEFADRPIEHLSSGQATRVAIAAALALTPQILLLDEPLADLDSQSSSELITLISRLQAHDGLTVVIAEHHTAGLERMCPRWLSVSEHVLHEGAWATPALEAPVMRISPVLGHDDILHVHDLSLSYGLLSVVEDVSFVAHVGEIIAVVGANGAGKSSLLNALALGGSSGDVVVRGRTFPPPSPYSQRDIVSVPEVVSVLFVAETLAEELARADKVAGHAGSGLTAMTFWSILSRTEDSSPALLQIHPRDLSAGTQLALAIALQLAWKPAVILIDEPTRGLDALSREAIAEVLQCVAETGTVVIVASHDEAFVSDLNARVLSLVDGRLCPAQVTA
jgi:energy-coupling factor transport system ATP-binding protein